MKILTAAQMQAVDRRAIDELGIPGLVLMENASVGVADALGRRFADAVTVAIFCGPGNNGGDGLALARILDARGYGVSTFLVTRNGSEAEDGLWGLQGDAAAQLGILRRASRPVTHLGPDDALAMAGALRCAAAADVVVDALFGTGLSRALEGHFAELVLALDRLRRPLIAVDLPSGLDGSRGAVPGPHLRADLTVTFAAPKIAHVTAPACDAVGDLAVVDLGIPPELVEEADGRCYLLTEDEVASLLAGAASDDSAAHKGTYGHVLLVGGSPGKSGAVVLAARAAVRSGAGLVSAAVPRDLLSIVDGASVESMTVGLAQDADGLLCAECEAQLADHLEGKAVVALGPGLGRGAELETWVRAFIGSLQLPLVLDADGLGAVAPELDLLSRRAAPTVLTPHPGEAGRLLGRSSAAIQEDRLAAAAELARRSGAVVALKGYRTVIAEPDGSLWINPTGDASLATGGSGDVLTGIVAALMAQGHDAASATKIGVYVHGLAGEHAGARLGRHGVAAGDLIETLGPIWRRLGGGDVCDEGDLT